MPGDTYLVMLVGGPFDGTYTSSHEDGGDIHHVVKLSSPYVVHMVVKDKAHHVYKRVSKTRAVYSGYTLEGERSAYGFLREIPSQ